LSLAPSSDSPSATILFDGVCNLCSNGVQFVIARDPEAYFRFAALQSEAGKGLCREHGIDPEALGSVVLIEAGSAYQKSGGALRIARRLAWPWPLFSLLLILPWFLRDLGYKLIARSRYRLFGKKEACWIPTPELRQRFLA